jgi:hypothetical protein
MARYAKLIAALVGAVTTAIAVGVAPAETGNYLAVVVSFLTALGVYVVPNRPPS